jgi:DNA polymerase-3 subunit alpha
MLSIEGLISGRSQHASSVIFYPKSFLHENAMMKTTKGLRVTQFNAEDGEYCGELKEDFLSISALGRIREAMDLLLEDGKIEYKGSLRKTYDAYFHPDVLDLTSKEMFNMLSNGDIFDAFQMSSLVARNAMRKIEPETFDEVAITNTIIRLQTDGEQPVDKFIRYKRDIQEWYQDMNKYGLSEKEIHLMEKHLLPRTGICDTQEILMNIIIDPKIANGGLTFANKFRKSVGKKDEKKIENASKEFMKVMKQNGQRIEFARYILEEQFALLFNYAFSLPHVVAYTLVLMVEMNIAHKYGLGYWKTACLNINSGLEGNITKGTDYAEVSIAVNSMSDDIVLPDINKSQLKFTAQEGKVLYGLKAIIGLDANTLDAIIENRPFNSLEDYYERMVETKLTSAKKTISLIKSGAMDNIEDLDRRHIMAKLVKLEMPQKEKVTMSQLDYYRDIIPSKYDGLLALHDFRNRIKGRNKEPMNKEIEKIFIKNYSNHVDYTFDDKLIIDIKSFEKYYNKEIKPLKEEIKNPKYAKEFTKKKRQEYWLKECSGSVEDWEIDTILFNSKNFALDTEQIKKTHDISEFNDLPNLPYKRTNKRGFKEYEISAIAGIVVGYNNQKKLVYILTKNSGVVTAKLTRRTYIKYQEQTENEKSWWERGTKLILLGYKNGEAFNVKGNNIYRKSVIKIERNNRKYVYRNEKI